jgi:hypothetical protein
MYPKFVTFFAGIETKGFISQSLQFKRESNLKVNKTNELSI